MSALLLKLVSSVTGLAMIAVVALCPCMSRACELGTSITQPKSTHCSKGCSTTSSPAQQKHSPTNSNRCDLCGAGIVSDQPQPTKLIDQSALIMVLLPPDMA